MIAANASGAGAGAGGTILQSHLEDVQRYTRRGLWVLVFGLLPVIAWLTLAPNNRITGGKLIHKRGKVIRPNRVAQALRLAAQTRERTQTSLGAFFRRMRARHGRISAIKATAHKLALIVYSMLKTRTSYLEAGVDYYETRYRETLLKSLTRKASDFGYALVPIEEVH